MPARFGLGVFVNLADVVESPTEGAFGAGPVAIKELEFVEVGEIPHFGFGFLAIELELVSGVTALIAEKKPAGEDGICDEAGVLVGGGLMLLERAFEDGEKLCGIFVG